MAGPLDLITSVTRSFSKTSYGHDFSLSYSDNYETESGSFMKTVQRGVPAPPKDDDCD